MAIVGGYTVFLPGFWEVQTFLFSYFMVFLFPVLFVGWKVVKRTRWYAPEEVDLKGEREEIEEVCFFFFLFSFLHFSNSYQHNTNPSPSGPFEIQYTRTFVPQPYKNSADKWFNKMFGG